MPPVNANLNPTMNGYSFGPSGEQYFNVPSFGMFGPTQVPRGMLPGNLASSPLTRNLSAAQLARLLAVPTPPAATPYTPSTTTPAPIMPPMQPGTAQPSPTGTPTGTDWPALISQWINQITGTPTPAPAPQPATVPDGVVGQPQTLTQSLTPLTGPNTTTDIPSIGDASTQTSKQAGGSTTIDNPTPAQIAAMLPSNLAPDISQAGKTGGLFTGGPATASSSAIPSGSGADVASTGKTGSAPNVNVNDLINAAIGVGGLAAPPGAGLLASLLKGGVEAYNGDTYNTNGLSNAQSLAYGPGMGERLASALAGLLSNQLPITAANDPNAQIGNQTARGGLTPGLFTGSPATAPTAPAGFDPSALIAGNHFGTGYWSGLSYPSMGFTTQQLGFPDLSGLSDIMSAAKVGMGGM